MVAEPGGRYARGVQRRNALIEAAAGLLLEEGLSAISHRAVAARAGLPLSSTTYYFASADDLRDEALQHLAEAWSRRADSVVEALPDGISAARAAEAVVRVIGADAAAPELLLVYERYLEAGRHERLRPVVVAWNAHLRELVRQVLARAGLPSGEEEARLVLAVADGVAVTALAEGRPPDAAVVTALRQVFTMLQLPAAADPRP